MTQRFSHFQAHCNHKSAEIKNQNNDNPSNPLSKNNIDVATSYNNENTVNTTPINLPLDPNSPMKPPNVSVPPYNTNDNSFRNDPSVSVPTNSTPPRSPYPYTSPGNSHQTIPENNENITISIPENIKRK